MRPYHPTCQRNYTDPRPDTSQASKDKSAQALKELGGEDAFYGKQGAGEVEKNPGNVAGGLKATINNPGDGERYVSDEAKQDAKDRLNKME